jgi:hypothetical protein
MIALSQKNVWQRAEYNSVLNRVRWMDENEQEPDPCEIHLTVFHCLRRADRKIFVEEMKYGINVIFPSQMFPDKAVILVANLIFEMETAQ